MLTLLALVGGLALLVAGAEILVRGASELARRYRIPPLIIGLTVVAYGTSAPEMAVSLASAVQGQPDLALGNVIGSNIFNVLFILGASALVTPLLVQRRLVRLDVPLMIGLSLVMAWMARDGSMGRLEGIVLLVGAVLYTVFLIRQGRRSTSESSGGDEGSVEKTADGAGAEDVDGTIGTARGSVLRNAALVLGGLVLLVAGSRLLIDSAVDVARALGASELVIGLTLIAAGTSLPEVATSLMAAIRGEQDLAVGNVVGSNVFNLLAVLGLTATVAPAGLPVSETALRFDLPVMIAVAVAALPIVFTAHRIDRWEGGLFLAYWLAYTGYLVLSGSRSPALPLFEQAMLWFALPLTAITLLVLSVRALRPANEPPTGA